jgi:hypothetical protein
VEGAAVFTPRELKPSPPQSRGMGGRRRGPGWRHERPVRLGGRPRSAGRPRRGEKVMGPLRVRPGGCNGFAPWELKPSLSQSCGMGGRRRGPGWRHERPVRLGGRPRSAERPRRGEKVMGPLRVRPGGCNGFAPWELNPARRWVAVWKAAAGPRHAGGMSAQHGGVAGPGRLGDPGGAKK